MPTLIRADDHRYGLRRQVYGRIQMCTPLSRHTKLDQTAATRDLMLMVTERHA